MKEGQMTRVEFHFDFGSPNAYFAHRLIPDIERRTGAAFIYVPILLGGVFKLTNNKPPMVQFEGIKAKQDYQRLETKRFIAKHGLARFRMNPHFPVNTLLIMRGAVAAEIDGRLAAYSEAVFGNMWEEGLKMDDPAVVRAAIDACGLDGAHILQRAQEGDVKDRLTGNTQRSVARGTFGAPTFFVGSEIFFGKDRLQEVEEEIAKARVAD
jgi:2-hydroxychromene-2-carboxylate isomerase